EVGGAQGLDGAVLLVPVDAARGSSESQDVPLVLAEVHRLEDGEDGEFLEEVAGHLVQLGLRRRRDDHAEVGGVPLELRLDGKRLYLLVGVVGEERLLGGLQDVLVLGRKVAAGRLGRRRHRPQQRQGGQGQQSQHSSHGVFPPKRGDRRTRANVGRTRTLY